MVNVKVKVFTKHLLNFPKLEAEGTILSYVPNYKDLFGTNLQTINKDPKKHLQFLHIFFHVHV